MNPSPVADRLTLAIAAGMITSAQAARLREDPVLDRARALLGSDGVECLDWLEALTPSDRESWLASRKASLDGAQRLVVAGAITVAQAAQALTVQLRSRALPCVPLATVLAAHGVLEASAQFATLRSEPRVPALVAEATVVSPPAGAPDPDAHAATLGGAVRTEAPISPAGASMPAGRTFGKYLLQDEVGRGGSGTVYRAWQTDLSRPVAIKVLTAGPGHESDLQRFQHEAIIAARLRHPHIATLYEVGTVDSVPYLAMEFIEGRTLKATVLAGGVESTVLARCVREIARALAYAHSEGVVHRDVKPENIMLTPNGACRVMDFGLARQVKDERHITVSGTILGTPAYMSPEQANGETHRLDALSDVYSLGAVLYFGLTGRAPFSGATLVETVYQVIDREPTPLRSLCPQVSAELAAICGKAMEKERERRYASMSAFAEDLDRWLSGEPVVARPSSWVYRLQKRVRKHPRTAMAAGLVALVLTAGSGYYLRETRLLAEEAERRSEETRHLAERMAEEKRCRERASKLVEQARFLRGADALAVLDESVALDPRQSEALRLRADLRRQARDYAGALSDLAALLELDPADARAVIARATIFDQALDRQEEAMAEYDRLLTLTVQRDVALNARGRARQMRKDESGARDDFAAALRENPHNVDAWLNHGVSLWRSGRLREALFDFRKASELEPKNEFILYWLAVIHHAASDYEQALAWEDQALERNPLLANAWLQRGVTLAELGRTSEAEASCRKAAELRPGDPTILAVLAHCHMELGRFDQAEAALLTALQHHPKSAVVRNNLGLVRHEQGRFPEALEEFDQALVLEPDNVVTLRNRARALVELGRHEDAVRDCERAIGINPAYPLSHLTRGWARFWQRHYVSALRSYEKFVEMAPKHRHANDARSGMVASLALIRTARKDWTTASAHLEAGESALRADDVVEARRRAQAAAVANPLLWGPALLACRAAVRQADWPAAREALARARDLGFPYVSAFLQSADMDAAREDSVLQAMANE